MIHKESNRALTIQSELSKLGAQISISEDVMYIQGIEKAIATMVNSHGDQRIAIDFVIMFLRAEGSTKIKDAEAVNKSFPNFFEYLEKIG